MRYYEGIGLLPVADRTPAGYRLYDDGTLQRLAFVARAKQLGCSLEEIADLATAWEGGSWGPVQDRLRRVVADKLARSQEQVAELIALTDDLQRAAAALERHGPCDERCGCIAGLDTDAACSLGAGALRSRVGEWQAVLEHVDQREGIAGGIRVVFGPSVPLDKLLQLTAAEQDCCQFFAFAITIDTRGIALEVSAPADASAIVESLFASPA